MNQQNRAVTPVVSTILMVAIVVILAATVSVFFFDVAEDINEPAPIVGDTAGEFEVADGDAGDKQIVKITHVAGDRINVENIEIVVRASGPGDDLPLEARLFNLPSDGFQRTVDGQNIRGDRIIDESQGSFASFNNPPQIIIVEDSNTWSPGQTIKFRIKVGSSGSPGADFRDPPNLKNSDGEADELEVIIVHTPSNAIISEHTFNP